MDKAIDKELYKKVKKRADALYEKHGLYKSAWIQKEYKRLGGKYSGKKPSESTGLQRWLKSEQWVEVEPYLTKGEIVMCGTGGRKGKACRPLKRATSKTPITLPELQKIHSKKTLLQLAKKKQSDMSGRVNWKDAKFTS